MTTPSSETLPVLICGGGPVGLTLAIELGRRGIECVVIEPREHPTRLRPRAKTLSTRTMEHFRRWGKVPQLRAAAPLPVSWSQDIAFRTSLLGPEVTRFTGVLGLKDNGVSPEVGQQVPQYVTEKVLREVAGDLPTVDLRIGSRVRSVLTGEDSVTVDVIDARGREQTITATYVAGADGARSIVRESIGSHYVGSTALRPNTGVVFHSADLMDRIPHPPAVQTWVVNDDTPGMLGPMDLHGLWWLIAFGVDGTSADLDPHALIDGAVGEPVPAEVISTDPWVARMELADQIREGRAFLVGDAAHLNPPFGGHGLNTGFGDAVDLGWKLAATLQGWAGPGLLESYAIERVPVHRRVIEEATANMSTLSTELLGADLTVDGPDGEEARAALAQRIRETKHQEFFSDDLVLGHRYATSPILPPDSSADAAGWECRALPGCRLPHVWLEPGLSTLDLVDLSHVVITGPDHDVSELTNAARSHGIPLDMARVPDAVMAGLGAEWIVVRPDHIVGACGDGLPHTDLLTTLTGHRNSPATERSRA